MLDAILPGFSAGYRHCPGCETRVPKDYNAEDLATYRADIAKGGRRTAEEYPDPRNRTMSHDEEGCPYRELAPVVLSLCSVGEAQDILRDLRAAMEAAGDPGTGGGAEREGEGAEGGEPPAH